MTHAEQKLFSSLQDTSKQMDRSDKKHEKDEVIFHDKSHLDALNRILLTILVVALLIGPSAVLFLVPNQSK